MNTKQKIASIVYPCNWGGDFQRCQQFRSTICSDYTRQKHITHVDDIMTAFLNNADDKTLAQVVFPCNDGGDFIICAKIHCPIDLMIKHKKQMDDIYSVFKAVTRGVK